MSDIEGMFVRNEAGDGFKPVCGKCGYEFEDGEIGDVKNYPEDGMIAVFFKCPTDGEVSFTYQPYKPRDKIFRRGFS